MPQPPPNYTIDSWRALVRHTVMSEEIESGKRRPVLVRRRTTAALEMPVISGESRAQYEYELTERAGAYMDAGMSEQEADRLALDDLGCAEFWAYMQSTNGLCSIDERSPVELSQHGEKSIPADFDFAAWWESLEARLRGDERRAVA